MSHLPKTLDFEIMEPRNGMSMLTFDCPHCGQNLEAPEELLGQVVACSSCDGQIQLPEPEPVKAPPHEAEAPEPEPEVPATPEPQPPRPSSPPEPEPLAPKPPPEPEQPADIEPPPPEPEALPDEPAAETAEPPAPRKRRRVKKLAILTAVLAVAIVTPLVLYAVSAAQTKRAAERLAAELAAEAVARDAALEQCEVVDTRFRMDGAVMRLTGKVRNRGETPVDFVKVQVEWRDRRGNVLDTGSAYAVGADPLPPGKSAPFVIVSPADKRMRKHRAWVEK